MGTTEVPEKASLLRRRCLFLSYFYGFGQLYHGEWFFEKDHVILNPMA